MRKIAPETAQDVRLELQSFNDFMLQLPACLQCGSRSEHVRPHVLRKYFAFLVDLLPTAEQQSLWGSMSNGELESLVADRNQMHQALPAHWTAATIGNFFGTPPHFVSMWACLWKGALQQHGPKAVSSLLANADVVTHLRHTLADYIEEHGLTPCPTELLTWHFRGATLREA